MHADPPTAGERYLKCQSGTDQRYHTCCEAKCNFGFVRDRVIESEGVQHPVGTQYLDTKALYYCDALTLKMKPCVVD